MTNENNSNKKTNGLINVLKVERKQICNTASNGNH